MQATAPNAVMVAQHLKAEAVAQAKARNAEDIMAKAIAFATANPDILMWLDGNPDNPFAVSLSQSLDQYGSLTEKQVAAVRRDINKIKDAVVAPVLTIERIEQSFATALSNQIRHPKLRLDTFEFTPAKSTGANPGAIYVKEDGQYLGKIMGGKFLRISECTDDQQARIVDAATNPEAAANAYGRRMGACSVCGRDLTSESSIDRAIGPVCAKKYGWA